MRFVCRGGARVAGWTADILLICVHRMHGVTMFSAMLVKVTRLCSVAMPVLILFTQQSARSFLFDVDAGLPFYAQQSVLIREEEH